MSIRKLSSCSLRVRALALTAAAGTLLIAAGDEAPLFPAAAVSVTSNPGSLHAVDVDRDGVLDLLSTSSSALVAQRGTGTGTLQPAQANPLFTSVFQSTTADFDGDGWLDVAGVRKQGNGPAELWVARGLGDGTFAPLATILVPTSAIPIPLASDVDLDGDADLVTADSVQLRLFLNDGAGAFTPGAVFTEAGSTRVVGGDLNGDAHPDFVLMGSGLAVNGGDRVVFSDGAGGYQPEVPLTVFGPATLGDTDGDGDLDIVVSAPGFVAVVTSDGDGGLAAPVNYPLPKPWDAGLVAVGDVSGDGLPDVVGAAAVGNFAVDGLWVLPSAGNGNFGALVTLPLSGPVDVHALADMDLDGRLDAIVSLQAVGGIAIARGTGSATDWFDLPAVIQAEGAIAGDALLADLDADGKPDVVVNEVHAAKHSLSVRLGLGGGAFGPPQFVESISYPQVAADFDEDGALDVVATSTLGPTGVAIFFGAGDGTLDPSPVLVGLLSPRVAVADLTGDGHLDLAVVDWETTFHGGWHLVKGHGDGTFDAPIHIGGGTGGISELDVGDIDGDRDIDVVRVTASVATTQLWVHVNDGTGGFSLLSNVPTVPNPWRMKLHDLDEDGVLDLLVTEFPLGNGPVSFPMGFTVMRGLGGGAFQTVDHEDMPFGGEEVEIGDIDGDGRLDVLAMPYGGSMAGIFRGQGDCHFDETVDGFACGYSHPQGALGDLDGDGRLDVLALDTTAAQISVLLQRAPPAWLAIAGGKPGAQGVVPQLIGLGTLQGGTPVALRVDHAAALAPAHLVIGFAELGLPFKGGTLVPSPNLVLGGLLTDADGDMLLLSTWPSGVPSGLHFFFQAWVTDPAATLGLSATPGRRATAP